MSAAAGGSVGDQRLATLRRRLRRYALLLAAIAAIGYSIWLFNDMAGYYDGATRNGWGETRSGFGLPAESGPAREQQGWEAVHRVASLLAIPVDSLSRVDANDRAVLVRRLVEEAEPTGFSPDSTWRPEVQLANAVIGAKYIRARENARLRTVTKSVADSAGLFLPPVAGYLAVLWFVSWWIVEGVWSLRRRMRQREP